MPSCHVDSPYPWPFRATPSPPRFYSFRVLVTPPRRARAGHGLEAAGARGATREPTPPATFSPLALLRPRSQGRGKEPVEHEVLRARAAALAAEWRAAGLAADVAQLETEFLEEETARELNRAGVVALALAVFHSTARAVLPARLAGGLIGGAWALGGAFVVLRVTGGALRGWAGVSARNALRKRRLARKLAALEAQVRALAAASGEEAPAEEPAAAAAAPPPPPPPPAGGDSPPGSTGSSAEMVEAPGGEGEEASASAAAAPPPPPRGEAAADSWAGLGRYARLGRK